MSNQQNINTFFDSFIQQVQVVNNRLADSIGIAVRNSTLENFQTKSFFGEKWKPRKDKKKHALLNKTGTMSNATNWKRTSSNTITVYNDISYAAIHNNGGTINRVPRSDTFVRNRYKTGKKGNMFGGMGAFRKGTTVGKGQSYKAYSMTMPMRKFLGSHPKLKAQLEQVIKDEFENEFK